MIGQISPGFRVPTLQGLGTADVEYPLKLVTEPVVLTKAAPEGYTFVSALLVQQSGIRITRVTFQCPTSFAIELPDADYKTAMVTQVWTPEGNRIARIKFGISSEFDVVSR